MENIYKIKVRTNPDPRWLYPSERRYSASTVLGLGVVHLALAFTALLLASLSLTANKDFKEFELQNSTFVSANSANLSAVENYGAIQEIENHKNNLSDTEDLVNLNEQSENTPVGEYNDTMNTRNDNANSYATSGPCIMCIGALAAGLTAILAWKRWYIDHNITWFFVMSFISCVTSTLSIILVTINLIDINYTNAIRPNLRSVIAINVLIASVLAFIWSILSTKIAYKGMRNSYPDDMMVCKAGGVKVSTIHKGNKKAKVLPPDILNHFPVGSKIAKYFPKKPIGNLPKDESNSEYQERVNKFLSSNEDTDPNK